DIFQAVISQRFSMAYSGDVFQVYRALRNINPSPYMFFLDFLDYQVIGSSPEPLIRAQDNELEIIPIAGTRQRGATSAEDDRLEAELLNDPKELAEHVMLVDLARNDLGRVATFGTVKVNDFKTIQKYSHVMHIISQVHGHLRDGLTVVDAFKSAFPAGTVSGAPKIRAMEIINELEPEKRGIYSGAIGYFNYGGNLDLCIGIRTIVAGRKRLYYQSGAGIVADSQPENEYQETLNKCQALRQAIEQASGGINDFIHR
ncbi:MAG: chorismate-binding protein, partial [Candidatus Marinimicrobia bacterium]|nr:chorismate-binding protein [Candidatus Neomarinimicrobiota bacterium]